MTYNMCVIHLKSKSPGNQDSANYVAFSAKSEATNEETIKFALYVELTRPISVILLVQNIQKGLGCHC